MNILPSNQIISALFTFDSQDGPVNSYFNQNGYQSLFLINNLGSTFLYLVANVVMSVLLVICKITSKYTYSKR